MATEGLPQQLVSRYRRYKAGTAHIVQWLGRTAKQYCELDGRLAWLKNTDAPVLKLKIHELLSLAQLIALSNPPLTIPKRLLEVLEDVIAGRQECGDWYNSQAIDDDTDMAKQNHTHAFLVTVLRKIRDSLKKLSATEAPMRRMDKELGNQKDELNNLFAYLELEEPSISPLGQSVPCESVKEPGAPKFVLEDQDSGVFALWCHLTDLNETRSFLVQLWSEYRQGLISIEVAGMVTETAFGMMRRTHEEFAAVHPKLSDWESVVKLLQLSISTNRNVVYATSSSPDAISAQLRAGKNPNDLICLGAGMLLTTFWHGSFSALGSVVGAQPGQRQFANAIAQVMGSVRPKTTLETPLLSLLPELLSLKWYALQGNAMITEHHNKTELTDGLIQLVIDGDQATLPMWLVVACQVCMDVDRMVDSRRHLGGDVVLQTASGHKSVVDKTLKFFEDMSSKCFDGTDGKGVENSWKQNLEEVRGIASTVLDSLEKTRIYDQPHKRQRMEEQVKFNHHRAKALHPGFDVFPHCAGYISWSLKVHAYDVGCSISNNQSVVIMLAHFYEMARKQGMVTAVWHDLEFVVARHSGKKPLITRTNDIADTYSALRHFLIDLGVEPSAFSGRKQPKIPSDKVIAARGKTIRPSSGSELLSVAGDEFREDEKRGHERANAFDIALTVLTENLASKSTPAKRRRHAKRQRYSTAQLLSTLKTHLIADEPNLNFDYFGFTELCLNILQHAVASGCQDENLGHLNSYRARLYWLMETAADAEAQSKPVLSTPFARAAAEMQEVIQARGSMFSDQACRLSSGTTSEQFRPLFAGDVPDTAVALSGLSEEYPNISVGSSRSTIEVYDPTGSPARFKELLGSRVLDGLLVGGNSELVETFAFTEVAEYFDASRPAFTTMHNGRAFRDNGETLFAATLMTGNY